MAAGSRSSASGSSACNWASSSDGSIAAASQRPAGWNPSMTQPSAPTHLELQTPREPQVPAGSWMAQQGARPIVTGHGATPWDGAVRATAQQPNTSPNNNVLAFNWVPRIRDMPGGRSPAAPGNNQGQGANPVQGAWVQSINAQLSPTYQPAGEAHKDHPRLVTLQDSKIRARSTDSSPAIGPQPTTTQFQMEALQAQVERQQQDMEARVERMVWQRMEAERQRMEAERQRMEAERQRMDEEHRLRMEQMLQYMQNFATATSMGTPLPQPPMIFPPPQRPTHTPNQSVASNSQAQDPDLMQPFAGTPPH